MPLISIEDVGDTRLDEYRDIPDPELIRSRGIFVAEGRLVVRRLLTESAFRVRSLMVTEPARAALANDIAQHPELPVYLVPQGFMRGITGFDIHRGCLAIGERPSALCWQDAITAARTILVLERVANADNVGGIFRCAAAFGAAAVLLDAASTDPLYRKAIRTSMGAALVVPFARAEPWPTVLHDLREQGFAVMAMTPGRSDASLRGTLEAVGSRPSAIVLGHEGEGLTRAALDACEYIARIPIASNVDSLNVASAAAIALYEISSKMK